MAVKAREVKIAWRPQPGPQLDAILATWCEELFFGGARGGGKSDFLLGDFAQDIEEYGEHWKGILFRKSYKELDEIVSRSKQIYPKLGGVFKKGEYTWVFPNGANLKLRHLEREEDVELYQGHQYAWIGLDELPNWPTPDAYLKLKACLRNGSIPIPTKRMRSTGNPGGAGHSWVKNRFIDPFPRGFTPIDETFWVKNGAVSREYIAEYEPQTSSRMFIPSKIQDNAILLKNDPFYISRLAQTGSIALVKAWLEGNWDAIEGAYFDLFNKEIHIIDEFLIPNDWFKIRAFDWGYSKPFCVLWGAISDGSIVNIGDRQIVYPRGSIIIYREYYGWTGKANEGLKITAEEIAANVRELQLGEQMGDQVADPAIFDVSSGESIADQMSKKGIFWRPADNKRVSGWQQVRARLFGQDGKPLLYFFPSCKSTLRTLPIMQYDKRKPEDLDSDLEDHPSDTLRYLCMSRPVIVDIPKDALNIAEQWWKDFNPYSARKKKKTGYE